MTRLHRALAVRDAILKWLPGNSRSEDVGGMRVQRADFGKYMLMFRTPFGGSFPAPRDYDMAVFVQQNGPMNLAYGLDLWEWVEKDGKRRIVKLMNLEWGHNGEAALRGFHKSDWDSALLGNLTAEKAA